MSDPDDIERIIEIAKREERERIIHDIITAYHNQSKWHKASRMLPDWLGQVFKEDKEGE